MARARPPGVGIRRPGRRPADAGRGSAPGVGGTQVEGRLVAQDRPLEAGQVDARIDAELVAEQHPGPFEGPERLGLPTGPVQADHQLLPSPLPQWLVVDQVLERGDGRGPQLELGIGSGFQGELAQLLEPAAARAPPAATRRARRRDALATWPAPPSSRRTRSLAGQRHGPGRDAGDGAARRLSASTVTCRLRQPVAPGRRLDRGGPDRPCGAASRRSSAHRRGRSRHPARAPRPGRPGTPRGRASRASAASSARSRPRVGPSPHGAPRISKGPSTPSSTTEP